MAVLAATAALGLAACGEDDEPAAPASGAGGGSTYGSGGGNSSDAGTSTTTLKVAADPGGAPKFTETALTADAGTVTVEFSNPSEAPHAVTIEGSGVDESTETVTAKDAAPLSVDLKAGEYTYYCPVGEHRAAGMEGTLTVK